MKMLNVLPTLILTVSSSLLLSPPTLGQPLPRLTPEEINLEPSSENFIPPNLTETMNASSGRAILDRDDRVAMTSREFPWSAIGRLVIPIDEESDITCTGTLIRPTVVLTNAHCLINPETHAPYEEIYFEPNLISGRVRDQADIAKAIALEYGTDFRNDELETLNPQDWGLVVLDKPLGEKYGTLGWLPFDREQIAEHPDNYVVVGYSGDFPEGEPGNTAGVHYECNLLEEADELLFHACDTMPGASGGPILTQVNGEFRLVGLHAGSVVTKEGEVFNYAVKLTRLVEWWER